MAWQDIIDQERVKEALRRAVERERVAHAYLFHGPDGVGKRAAALEFAKTLQCEAGEGAACDACTACRKVGRMIHPDVHVLFPYPNDADEEDIAERLQRLGEHPYATIDFVRRPSLADPTKTSNKQAFYSVARINEELRRSMSYKPHEGRYKVVVLTDAEGLRVEAANAFLKLLEEPPPRTVFILTTARPDRLLPTILSRCQRLRFAPLPDEAIERALVREAAVEPALAATLARMADGSYSRALDLAENEELLAGRQLVLDFFRLAYSRSIDKQADLVEEMAKMGRERMKGMLNLMLRWIRDLVLYRTMGAEAPLVNVDQQEAVARFCRNVPGADLEAMIGLVEDAIELVERNVHLGLVCTVLGQRLYQAMQGGGASADRLYVPLAAAEEVLD